MVNSMPDRLLSKVLVLDDCAVHADAIKTFCDQHNLVALKVQKDHIMSVLGSNIDLGAILYSECYGETSEENTAIAVHIHTLRPELPIFLRRHAAFSVDGVSKSL